MAAQTHAAINATWQLEAAKIIGALMRVGHDLALAEDCAQEALLAALEHWPVDGLPNNPAAWLMTTAKHRLLDRLRHGQMAAREQAALGLDADARDDALTPDPLALLLANEADELRDDVLPLLFIACHPLLSREAQWALTLRLVCGLSVAEIARACFAQEAAVAARITRAKKALAGQAFGLPPATERLQRLGNVLTVLYLMFNEGYSAHSGPDCTRPALCHEALRLTRMLTTQCPQDSEVLALQALMELQASRLPARADAQGRPVLLMDQDRRLWNPLLRRRGLVALEQAEALAAGDPGPYLFQALLAACHARALRAQDTDWRRILQLYDALLEAQPSPVIALNRAVALAQVLGPEAALLAVDRLADALHGYPWWASVRADFCQKLQRFDEASAALDLALAWTQNEAERSLLRARQAALAQRGDGDAH